MDAGGCPVFCDSMKWLTVDAMEVSVDGKQNKYVWWKNKVYIWKNKKKEFPIK